ncbi:MAG: hypothetical protein HQM08_28005 [Candidatus Riflebacteria bacterium]|nr:hypothetical protein [Candidatus Riflebacteria bacterium]
MLRPSLGVVDVVVFLLDGDVPDVDIGALDVVGAVLDFAVAVVEVGVVLVGSDSGLK